MYNILCRYKFQDQQFVYYIVLYKMFKSTMLMYYINISNNDKKYINL